MIRRLRGGVFSHFTSIPHPTRNHLTQISQRFHIFTARSAAKIFAPAPHRDNLRNKPRDNPAHGAAGTTSHTHRDNLRDNPRDNPAHAAAGVAGTPQTASGTPSYRDNLSPARSFASPRPHARHEPKPKSISRLGVLGGLTPSTSNIWWHTPLRCV